MVQILEQLNDFVPVRYGGQRVPLVLHCDGQTFEQVMDAQNAHLNAVGDGLEGLVPVMPEWQKRLLLLQVVSTKEIILEAKS